MADIVSIFDPFALGGRTDQIFGLIAAEERTWNLATAARGRAERACSAEGRSWLKVEEEGDPRFKQTHRLEGAAIELGRRVLDTPATTLLGAIRKLEWAECDREAVGSAIADLRRLASGGGAAIMSSDHCENDARVLALFHDWLDASRMSDRHAGDDDETEYEAARDRCEEIENEIMSDDRRSDGVGDKDVFQLEDRRLRQLGARGRDLAFA
jgi:hypothetical protein